MSELSLDHDLGLLEGEKERTGYDVLLWIEEQVVLRGYRPPRIAIHSANSSARQRMLAAIDAITRRAGNQSGGAAALLPEGNL